MHESNLSSILNDFKLTGFEQKLLTVVNNYIGVRFNYLAGVGIGFKHMLIKQGAAKWQPPDNF
jgi:hypothetical protein